MSNDSYEIGYKKPPKHSQFQPGQSGNKNGRKKGVRNIATDLQNELSHNMVIQENGESITLTKQQLFLKQLCNSAIKGSSASGSLLAKLINQHIPSLVDTDESNVVITKADQDILNHYTSSIMEKI